MDKARMKKLLGDIDQFAKDLEAAFPKARNKVNSLMWSLKAAREELEKPDVPVVPAVPPVKEGA